MAKASIPNVLGGLLELPNGKVVELESVEGFQWLASPDFRSFRFEDGLAPYTCRKEKVKGTDGYWYGYQRVGGKVTKRYIGKTSDLSQARLIEVSSRFHALPKSHLPLPKSALVSSSKLGNKQAISMLPNELGNMPGANELPDELPSDLCVDVPNRLLVADLPGNSPSDPESDLLNGLKAELAHLKSDNERLKQELVECRQELDSYQRLSTESQEAIEPAKLLNQLRQQDKRSKVTLRDLERIFSLIAGD